MPSKSPEQQKMIFAKRSQYKTKENAPDKWKWVFEKGWDKLEETKIPAEEVAEAEEVGDEFIKKIKNKNTTNLVTKTLFPNEMRSNTSNVTPIGESKKMSYIKIINEGYKEKHTVNGKEYNTFCFYSDKEANAFMEKNPDWGVIDAPKDGKVWVANKHDRGTQKITIREVHYSNDYSLGSEKFITKVALKKLMKFPKVGNLVKYSDGTIFKLTEEGEYPFGTPGFWAKRIK